MNASGLTENFVEHTYQNRREGNTLRDKIAISFIDDREISTNVSFDAEAR